jgi:hypothetical protein
MSPEGLLWNSLTDHYYSKKTGSNIQFRAPICAIVVKLPKRKIPQPNFRGTSTVLNAPTQLINSQKVANIRQRNILPQTG